MKHRMWKCANCKRIKELGTEIARADLNAVCKSCQSGLNADATTDANTPAQQVVYVHRRGFVRRHSRDNRDID